MSEHEELKAVIKYCHTVIAINMVAAVFPELSVQQQKARAKMFTSDQLAFLAALDPDHLQRLVDVAMLPLRFDKCLQSVQAEDEKPTYSIVLCGTTYNVVLRFRTYTNGRIAIELIEPGDDMQTPVCRATVNIPEVYLRPNHVLLKTWSENEGLVPQLEQHGIIKLTGRRVKTGFAYAVEAELLVPAVFG